MTEKINPLLLSSEIGDEYHKDVAAPDTKTMRFATHVDLKTFEDRDICDILEIVKDNETVRA